jgi:hypothetical protein
MLLGCARPIPRVSVRICILLRPLVLPLVPNPRAGLLSQAGQHGVVAQPAVLFKFSLARQAAQGNVSSCPQEPVVRRHHSSPPHMANITAGSDVY